MATFKPERLLSLQPSSSSSDNSFHSWKWGSSNITGAVAEIVKDGASA
jgi:hypothetical protein